MRADKNSPYYWALPYKNSRGIIIPYTNLQKLVVDFTLNEEKLSEMRVAYTATIQSYPMLWISRLPKHIEFTALHALIEVLRNQPESEEISSMILNIFIAIDLTKIQEIKQPAFGFNEAPCPFLYLIKMLYKHRNNPNIMQLIGDVSEHIPNEIWLHEYSIKSFFPWERGISSFAILNHLHDYYSEDLVLGALAKRINNRLGLIPILNPSQYFSTLFSRFAQNTAVHREEENLLSNKQHFS